MQSEHCGPPGLVGCWPPNKAATVAAKGMRLMSADSPQACTADFTAALIGRDIDAALALLTDDVVFFYSNGAAIRGKNAFAALMTASWKMVENYKYTTVASAWVTQSDDAA